MTPFLLASMATASLLVLAAGFGSPTVGTTEQSSRFATTTSWAGLEQGCRWRSRSVVVGYDAEGAPLRRAISVRVCG